MELITLSNISEDIKINSGILTIRETPVDRFRLYREIGRGANGIVFEAQHIHLERACALKIWLQLRAGDQRDKVLQGMYEARKLAAAHPDWVAQIYDAEVINGVFFASIELIPGVPLKKHLQNPLTKEQRWWLARLYLNWITKTTTDDSAHGDPHSGNVLVYEHTASQYDRGTRLKFIDFGTSKFLGAADWRERHWRVVGETMSLILKPFPTLALSRKIYGRFIDRPDYLKISYWDDVLHDVRMLDLR